MSKIFFCIIFLYFGLVARAVEIEDGKKSNQLTFNQIDVENAWLKSGNAAGLSQMPDLFPSEIKLNFGQSKGNFHSIFNGESIQNYNFSSRGYRKMNRTFLYGSFDYSRSFEKGLNYSNTNDPAMNYPYLLADTIGKDTYDREFFKLNGIMASPVNCNLEWGLNVEYQVGIASQNRDPRSENKVMRGNFSPALLYKLNRFKFGANLTYGYYNEDIDVSVVETGIQRTMFQMHGLGQFGYHSSSSFYRLYKQNQVGGGLQFEVKQNEIANILHSNYLYFQQTIDDGRKGSIATWAAVKNDAKMDGINWNITDVLSISRGKRLHQLKAVFQLANKLGTEYIQRLEKVGETDMEHWITYAEEQKYYSLQTSAGADYQLLMKDADDQMKSLFRAGLSYSAFDEKYYLPNLEAKYTNLAFESSFLKRVALSASNFSAEMRFKYQINAGNKQDMDAGNFTVQKIYLPEIKYLTTNFFSPGFSVGYEMPVKKYAGNYFLKSDFDWYHGANGLNRTFVSFSTGIIF